MSDKPLTTIQATTVATVRALDNPSTAEVAEELGISRQSVANYLNEALKGGLVQINLDKKIKHTIDIVVDRLVVSDKIRTRLTDSVETALKLAEGLAYVDLADGTVAALLPQTPLPGGEGLGEGDVYQSSSRFFWCSLCEPPYTDLV